MKGFWLFFFGGLTTVLTAQIDTSDIYELSTVTVQAGRFSTEDTKVPIAITAVPQAFLQRGQAQLSVNESLDAVPGLFALNANNFAQDLRVSIRGFGARSAFGIRGVKVIVDGIPESTPDGQAQVDNLDLGVIDRLEVVRGPASGLYGNASGGVLQFTTQEPAQPFVSTRVLAGSYGLQQYQLKTGQQRGRFGYLLHGLHVRTDGYRENSGMRNSILNGKFNFAPNENGWLQLLLNYANSPQADDPGGINLEQVETDRRSARDRNLLFRGGESVRQYRVGLTYEQSLGDHHQINARTWYSNRDFNNRLPFENGGVVAFERRFAGAGLQYQYERELGSHRYRMQFGVDVQGQTDDRQRFNNREGTQGELTLEQAETFRSTGFYLNQQWEPSNQFLFQLALRYDAVNIENDDQFLINGDQSGSSDLSSFNPTLGISYRPSDRWTLYANYATSFETPTLVELSNNPSGLGGFNDELAPQEARNLEVGTKGIINNRLRYELTLFHIDVTNEIIPFELEDFPGRTFYRNAGSTNRTGIESSLTYRLASAWNAHLNYTYSHFTYDDFQDFNGNFLPVIPRHTSLFALTHMPDEGFFGAIQARYVGDLFAKDDNSVSVAGFTVVNLRLGYRHTFQRAHVEPFFGVNNLFSAEYFDNIRPNAFGSRFYEPAPTVNFYGGFKIHFGKT